jgi:4-aminobutyrate aminotransferase-like enzyme/Ser/Thr protein kinase RdoA (MazF antagonist)
VTAPIPFADRELRNPAFTAAQAADLAVRQFGVAAQARPLGSHQDQNFLLENGDQRLVLKISNPAFSHIELELQNRVMAHLARAAPPFAVPAVRPDRNGREIAEVELDGRTYLVRLITFLDGETFQDVPSFAPVVLRELGALAGRVVATLTTFDHPGADRRSPWDVRNARAVVDRHAPGVADDRRRALATAVTDRAWRALAPLAPALRVQVIHGDVTDVNVVATRDPAGRLRPTGLIDFGDATRSWLVAEPAILCSSFLHCDPARALQLAATVVGAFHRVVALTEDELAALWPCVVARAASCAVATEHQATLEPDSDYLAAARHSDWAILDAVAPIPFALAREAFRAACGSPAVLRTALPPAVPLVASRDPTEVDLSVTSDLAPGAWERAADLAAHIVQTPGTAIGRHGEARLPYARPDSRVEPASIHLGRDVFLPAGTEVRAPWDGTLITARPGELVLRTAGLDLRLAGIEPYARSTATAGEVIALIASPPPGAPLPAHLHVQLCTERLDALPGLVPSSLAPAWLALCPDPAPLLHVPETHADRRDVLALRKRHVASPQVHYYEQPPRIERGFRHHLYDTGGRAYVDMVNNVAILGHSHPAVAAAAARQLRRLNTNSRFLYGAMSRFAERLAALAPDGLDSVFLVNSGSEANDLALRLIRKATAARDALCIAGSYHGWTQATYDVSTSLVDNPRSAAARPPWIHVLEAPSIYRGRFRGPDAAARHAEVVVARIQELRAAGVRIAGVICEPLAGNAGGEPLPAGYLRAVYAAVRGAGGLCVADEVQVGYGRLGESFWAFELQGVVPDVITIGKATGNGHPVAAVITRRALADGFGQDAPWFSSVGGSPVSCEVGIAVLDAIRDEGLQDNARVVGAYLRRRLEGLVERYPICGAVHGMGLYLGLELVRDRETRTPAADEAHALCERMRELGVIVQPTGDFDNVLKIKPPLCFTAESAEFFADTLGHVLDTGW